MVPYRTFLVLGLAVGLLGAGYVFAPQPGSATAATAPLPKAAPVADAATPAAPTAKPASKLVANRAPVPLMTRTHKTYFIPKEAETSVPGSNPGATDISKASLTVGAGLDGGLPPAPAGARSADSAQAKAAVELDGYKNVRGLEKGPDGIWRGRAMRGRTEIAIRVDASGSVSAD
jgi:hypothetical protein